MTFGARPWSAEAEDELRRLHAKQPELSFEQIAIRMCKAGYPVTRNACIGKARRMKLPPREPPSVAEVMTRLRKALEAKRRRNAQPRRRKPVEKEIPFEVPAEVGTGTRTGLLIDLDFNQCRWPVTEIGRATYLFCCNDRSEQSSWCRFHRRLGHDRRVSR